jgi:hypothetical protein
MGERAVSRAAAISIIDRLPGPGEPYDAGPILDVDTVQATAIALRYVVAQKDLDIPGMEILAAKLGTPGTDYDLRRKKRHRELLWNAAEFYDWLARQLIEDEPEAVTKP